jgi:hypothetical protein
MTWHFVNTQFTLFGHYALLYSEGDADLGFFGQ